MGQVPEAVAKERELETEEDGTVGVQSHPLPLRETLF